MEPLNLVVPRNLIGQYFDVGDIVTLGSPNNPARDWRTGAPIPHDREFRIVVEAET